MMKKRYLGIVCLITACALLCCGCGDKGTAILIGETKEAADVPAEGEQEAWVKVTTSSGIEGWSRLYFLQPEENAETAFFLLEQIIPS